MNYQLFTLEFILYYFVIIQTENIYTPRGSGGSETNSDVLKRGITSETFVESSFEVWRERSVGGDSDGRVRERECKS